jgi:hypothetical protein
MDDEVVVKLNALGHEFPHYDKLGLPIPFGEWARRMEDQEYRIIGNTQIGDVEVSTIWLGLDHHWGGGPPILFETMIFGGEYDRWQIRYSTEEEARAGHEVACRMVRGA